MDVSFRKIIISLIIIGIALIFLVRIFYIQIIDDSYKLSAENNSRRMIVEYPARGLIYDRNGRLIVANEPSYDLLVIYGQVGQFDTILLSSILGIEKEILVHELRKASKENRYRPYPLIKQINAATYIALQEKLHRFPGFYAQVRTSRNYLYDCGALIFGYVREVDAKNIEDDPYYEQGDYIGKIGIELTYERYLRGVKGVSYQQVDVKGRVKGIIEDGRHDKQSIIGKHITSTIDIELQKYAEELMRNKVGSVVAIEPATGEVLTMVSSPTFSPYLMVGQNANKYYKILANDPNKPLYNRAIQGDRYPPGSTFKVFNALIAKHEGIVTDNYSVSCKGGYFAGRLHVGCHEHPSPVNLIESIKMSCNAYYCTIFRAIIDAKKFGSVRNGYITWRNHITSFGMGNKLGIDLPSERPGLIPKPTYYDSYYGKNRWRSLTIVSLSIGQGEISMTPLQMANSAAVIANRGYYFTPHLVREIQDTTMDDSFKKKHNSTISPQTFEPIIEGMYQVVHGINGATARHVAIPGIEMCGKTGTAQNPHGKDHSIFMAFAPRHNPQIAIAVYIENSGFGAVYAAPIASLIIEKYLTDTVKRHAWNKRMLEMDLINPAGHEK